MDEEALREMIAVVETAVSVKGPRHACAMRVYQTLKTLAEMVQAVEPSSGMRKVLHTMVGVTMGDLCSFLEISEADQEEIRKTQRQVSELAGKALGEGE